MCLQQRCLSGDKCDLHDLNTNNAVAEGTTSQRREALAKLGITSLGEARQRLKVLGRKGQAPWSLHKYRHSLGYICQRDVVAFPVAHCLLMGVLQALLVYDSTA